MGGLFSGRQRTQTTTQDPWAVLPPEIRQNIIDNSGYSADAIEQAVAEAMRLGSDPRDILGMNDTEREALDQVLSGITESGELGDAASAGLSDAWGGLYGREGYESGYTDEVVDTTLLNMQRQADRDRLVREGRAAAVGGTSNTRAAVGDAVADNLTGLSMAEMEAQLRDSGFRFGAEMDLEEKGLDLTRRGVLDDMATSGLTRSMAGADWLKGYGAEERGLDQLQLDENRTGKQQSLSWLQSMLSGNPNSNTTLGGGVSTGQVQTPSLFGQILGGVSSVAGTIGMLSDEDTKEDILRDIPGIDALKDVTPASYRYRDDAPIEASEKQERTSGLIAQDLTHIEGAVRRREDGYLEVQPYAILATVVQAVKDLDARTNPNQAGL